MKLISKHSLNVSQLYMIGIQVMMSYLVHQTQSIFQLKERSKREFGPIQFLYGLQNINLILKNYWENALKEIGNVVKFQNLLKNKKIKIKLKKCYGKHTNQWEKHIDFMVVSILQVMYFQCHKILHQTL